MKTLAYITTIPNSEISGGISGINAAILRELKAHFNVVEIPHISVPVSKLESTFSKIQKLLRLPRKYFYFSKNRLDKYSKEFELKCHDLDVDAYFFYGFTSWICTTPDKPYFCINDASFSSYLNIYNNPKEFQSKDIERILRQEKTWLTQAHAVFFQSNFALNDTITNYSFTFQNFINVGVGGFITPPLSDTYSNDLNFVFISREFAPKGGEVVLRSFLQILTKHPQAELNIVGGPPPEWALSHPNINYLGFLDKSKENDLSKLRNLFSQAFLILHPTKKDINPLVLIELAYFGCPAITSNSFAIPEYVIDNETGYTLMNPDDERVICDKIEYLISDRKQYLEFRNNSRTNSLSNNTWVNVGNKIARIVEESL